MKKIIYRMMMLSVAALFFSCAHGSAKAGNVDKFAGHWTRVGDAAAGDEVTVLPNKDLQGIVSKLSPLAIKFDYHTGDIKWRHIKITGPDTFELENLDAQIYETGAGVILSRSKRYTLFSGKILPDDSIELKAKTPEPNTKSVVGNVQYWRKK